MSSSTSSPPDDGPPDERDLAAALTRAVARGAAAWPALEVEVAVFRAYLVARLPAEGDPLAALEAMAIEDLYLACACVAGERRAIAAFTERFVRVSVAAAARSRRDGPAADDMVQLVLEKLLAPRGELPPRLAEFVGQGGLRAWVRVTVVRAGIDLERTQARRIVPDTSEPAANLEAVATTTDPELDYLKRHYRDEFRQAFAAALAELDPRSRNALRHHLIDRLSIDQIGALYNVHRATAARWISRSREALLAGTREQLRGRLQLSEGEYASIMRLIDSMLEISVQRLLSS
ncbi:sigma-70 family RNA polymerase sigma factor [Nannocystis radixulma]|uniref:Sigma-70 family RNA polymerase sigma factor n=1 Tax=Nannocystis radixulma TaxID=2995305 RepID=A0ABT5B1Y1_9BACT|nr:sigma-70 family RNA polymerase sigma factor [Nannocystis radixulma]MDC0668117.1 sigma-70 family RNA polymerase sigma factor [Nannocystis radixulma]